MNTPIVKGLPTLSFQGNRFDFDPRRGYVPDYSYSGPFSAAVQYAFGLASLRIPYRFEQDGSFATVTLKGNIPIDSASPPEVPVDKWDFRNTKQQIDIHLHPNALAIGAAMPGALQQIDYDITNGNYTGIATPRKDTNGNDITVVLPTGGSLGGYVLAYKALLANNDDHYDAVTPVLRHTYTISDGYTGSAFNFSNGETVYTMAALLAECAAFPYPLPGPYIQAITSLPVLAAVGCTAGWKKAAPDFNTAARLKNEVVTLYEYGLWDTSFKYTLFT